MDHSLAPYEASLKKAGLLYDGTRQPTPEERKKGCSPYKADAALIRAVNLAIFLKRPLLLMGEPGCGKTVVAQHVALNLGGELLTWHVKSTSRACDGLYRFDAMARLREGQMVANGILKGGKWIHKVQDPKNYRQFGPLGKALSQTDQKYVLLIDEIDKADLDFPNDLLRELDAGGFTVEETGEHFPHPSSPPVIIITSNREKELPEPFLRRCIFHFIPFPDEPSLREIVQLHMPEGSVLSEELTTSLVQRFSKLHGQMGGESSEKRGKPVSTSELLDWVKVLCHAFFAPEASDQLAGYERELLQQLQQEKLLYPELLLKTEPDRAAHLKGKGGR